MSHDPPTNGEPPNHPEDYSQDHGATAGGAKRRRRLPTDLREQLSTHTPGLANNNLGDHTDGGEAEGPVAGGIIAPRPAFTELRLEESFQTRIPPEEQKEHRKNIMKERLIGKKRKTKKDIALSMFHRTFPFVRMLKTYNIKAYGSFDLISGISVGLFLIPQSMAYALLANVRPQYGFYSAFICMVIYFFFGSSAHVNMTNQGAVSLLVGEAVRAGVDQVYPNGAGLCETAAATTVSANMTGLNSTVAELYSTTAVSLTTMGAAMNGSTNAPKPCVNRDDANANVALTITMLAGALQLLGAFLRLGFLTIYLSDPINKAFTCGAAMHIVSGQVGNILGAPVPSFSGNGKFFLVSYACTFREHFEQFS